MKKDIKDLTDVKLLVDSFYEKIRADEKLGEIFNTKIENRWSEHLEKMYRFWQTVLLEEHTYHGSPFVPHAKLPVEKFHFDRWLKIFNTTVNDLFSGEKADKAKSQGERMAIMFNYKIDFYKNNAQIPIL